MTPEAARIALTRVTSTKIHQHFGGYLAAVMTAKAEGRTDNLRVNFKKFYDDYLLVGGAPAGKPYIQPFPNSAKPGAQLFNDNPAGSYSVSSIRPEAPLRQVIEYAGKKGDTTHTLRPEHERLALQWLSKTRIPAHALATVLFRDYEIERVPTQSDPDTVLQQFCVTLGYDLSVEESRARFDVLYEMDASIFDGIQYAEDVP